MSIMDLGHQTADDLPEVPESGPVAAAVVAPSRSGWVILCLIVAGAYALAALVLLALIALPDWPPLAGHRAALQQIHEIFFRFSLIGLVLVPMIFLLEAGVVGWRASSLHDLIYRSSATARSDVACFLLRHSRLSHWPQIVMTFGATLISGMLLHDAIVRWTGWNLVLTAIPIVPRVVLFYLLYTCLDYWAHRFDHMSLLWPMHRFHHAAEDFNVLTAARGHPGSAMTQLAIKTLPMAALGMSMTDIIDLNMFVAAAEYFIHSRLPFRLGWIGGWVIQSPLHHRLHHVKVYDGRSWNYSLCPLWDRLFGTWRDTGYEPVSIGIEYEYRHGAWVARDMMRDYGEFLAHLLGIGASLVKPYRQRRQRKADEPHPADMPLMMMPAMSLSDTPLATICDTKDEARFEEFRSLQPAPANSDDVSEGPTANV